MGVQCGKVGVEVAGAEGIGKRAVLIYEGAGAGYVAANGRGGKTLLAFAQLVSQPSQQGIGTSIHDDLVETRIKMRIGIQVCAIQRSVLFCDGRV